MQMMLPIPPKIAVPEDEDDAGSSETGAGVAGVAAPRDLGLPAKPVGGAPPETMEPPAKGDRPPSAAGCPLDALPKLCIGGAAALPEMERPLGNTILDNAGLGCAGFTAGIDSAGLCVTGCPATTGSPAGACAGLPAILAGAAETHAGAGDGLPAILASGTGACLTAFLAGDVGADWPPGAAESEGSLMSIIGFIDGRPKAGVPAVTPDMAMVGYGVAAAAVTRGAAAVTRGGRVGSDCKVG